MKATVKGEYGEVTVELSDAYAVSTTFSVYTAHSSKELINTTIEIYNNLKKEVVK